NSTRYLERSAAAFCCDKRNPARSRIWSGVTENFGIPLSMRPASRMGPIIVPVPLSCKTTTERTRLGPPSPPVAPAPGQNAQLAVYSCLPRCTTSFGGSGGKPRKELIDMGFCVLTSESGDRGGLGRSAGFCAATEATRKLKKTMRTRVRVGQDVRL